MNPGATRTPTPQAPNTDMAARWRRHVRVRESHRRSNPGLAPLPDFDTWLADQ